MAFPVIRKKNTLIPLRLIRSCTSSASSASRRQNRNVTKTSYVSGELSVCTSCLSYIPTFPFTLRLLLGVFRVGAFFFSIYVKNTGTPILALDSCTPTEHYFCVIGLGLLQAKECFIIHPTRNIDGKS